MIWDQFKTWFDNLFENEQAEVRSFLEQAEVRSLKTLEII